MPEVFRVGLSNDFQIELNGIVDPVLEEVFGPIPFVEHEFFAVASWTEIQPHELNDYDAVMTIRPHFTPRSFADVGQLALISRWGVGYDMIDIPAATAADVLVSITTEAVGRPVAEAILTLVLALAKKLMLKEKLARTGRWDLKAQASGLGLRGKVLGSVGLGHIGTHLFTLLPPFGLARMLAHDPYVSEEKAARLDVELVDLERVFRESDFVAINCPLNEETRGLVNSGLLSLMKPTAYLINTARGAIVNEEDLLAVLQTGQIAGAGLDVFAQEPLPPDHPFTQLDNVILSPHGMAWTDDLYYGNSYGACQNILTLFRGDVPQHIVNREVVERPGFQRKLAALRARWNALAAHHQTRWSKP
jgi:phosphoglycerate dehydrogenase-like enzyme